MAGLARSSGAELLVLRACRPPLAGADFACWSDAEPDPAFMPLRNLCEQPARPFANHAFGEALTLDSSSDN